ncbi:hypothetical protein SSS_06374 [Sarcoptes scabiei]|uniref:Uncharacterized protein n=2 Tax=Sarcoptes scabiei TaxID=52283 RepID=A0A834R6S5_SARSC|nr:hypothetical protein SSS_06374 [Sarcoptes scabiei]
MFKKKISNLNSILRFQLSTAITFDSFTTRILVKHGFDQEQCGKIVDSLNPLLRSDSHRIIAKSLEAWRTLILPRSKSDYKTIERCFLRTFSEIEPRLLLIEKEFLEDRIEKLQNLDLFRGKNDLWIALPNLEEIVSKRSDSQHPIMLNASVMENDYFQIKTRFIFAQRTGFRVNQSKDLNLNTMFLTTDRDFLNIYAKYCSMEEYRGLEKLNSMETGTEDDEIFEDLVKLSPKSNKIKAEKSEKNFVEKTIEEGILLNTSKRML